MLKQIDMVVATAVLPLPAVAHDFGPADRELDRGSSRVHGALRHHRGTDRGDAT